MLYKFFSLKTLTNFDDKNYCRAVTGIMRYPVIAWRRSSRFEAESASRGHMER